MENKDVSGGIVLDCTLLKLEQDKDGLWTIRLQTDETQAVSVLELSKHTQKVIRAVFFATEAQTFGKKLTDL